MPDLIAVFGGTFDPVHRGHVQSALELKQRLQLDQLSLMPCHLPPHRSAPGASSDQRLAMLKLATAGTGLLVDDRELKRNRTSYSVETLEQLRAELGNVISLCWVMGTDAFAGLDSWYRWQELLDLAHIIVMARPGESLPETGLLAGLLAEHQAHNVAELSERPAGKIWCEQLTPFPVSATAIRQQLAGGQPTGDALAPDVLHYIRDNHLYGSD